MKFNTQNLVLVIVFQLMIAGATLYITETNAGAVEYCTGIGEKCEYSGSAGCGVSTITEGTSMCACDIEFTYCTQTSTSRALEDKLKSRGK